MFTYYITFRIANRTAEGLSYNERRNLLVQNARKAKGGYWDETTSFFLVESGLSTYEFAAQVCDGLSDDYDMVVVIDPSDNSAAYFGDLEHLAVLKSFFPKLKKVP